MARVRVHLVNGWEGEAEPFGLLGYLCKAP